MTNQDMIDDATVWKLSEGADTRLFNDGLVLTHDSTKTPVPYVELYTYVVATKHLLDTIDRQNIEIAALKIRIADMIMASPES